MRGNATNDLCKLVAIQHNNYQWESRQWSATWNTGTATRNEKRVLTGHCSCLCILCWDKKQYYNKTISTLRIPTFHKKKKTHKYKIQRFQYSAGVVSFVLIEIIRYGLTLSSWSLSLSHCKTKIKAALE